MRSWNSVGFPNNVLRIEKPVEDQVFYVEMASVIQYSCVIRDLKQI